MAVVLVAIGAFVDARVRTERTRALDAELRTQVARRTRTSVRAEDDERAQLLDARGAVLVASLEAGRAPLLGRADVRRLLSATDDDGAPAVLVRRASSTGSRCGSSRSAPATGRWPWRARSLDDLETSRRAAHDAGARWSRRTRAGGADGLRGGGRGAAAGRADAGACCGGLRPGPGRAASGAARPRRDPAARRDAQRDARPPPRRARARAALRRRREPRAAHAAVDPEGRAGAGRATGPHARGAARDRRIGERGDRPARAALPRTCSCWRARTATACPCAPSRSTPASCCTRSRERFVPRARQTGRRAGGRGARGVVLHGDRLRLEQALGNLLDNALLHGAGTIQLTAQARGRVRFACATRARASRPPSPPPRSSASRARTRRAGAAARASDSRSSPRSRTRTAAAPGSTRTADVWIELPAERARRRGDGRGAIAECACWSSRTSRSCAPRSAAA